jgi:hypothetical protein
MLRLTNGAPSHLAVPVAVLPDFTGFIEPAETLA